MPSFEHKNGKLVFTTGSWPQAVLGTVLLSFGGLFQLAVVGELTRPQSTDRGLLWLIAVALAATWILGLVLLLKVFTERFVLTEDSISYTNFLGIGAWELKWSDIRSAERRLRSIGRIPDLYLESDQGTRVVKVCPMFPILLAKVREKTGMPQEETLPSERPRLTTSVEGKQVFRPSYRWILISLSVPWLVGCGLAIPALIVNINPVENPPTILGPVLMILFVAGGVLMLLMGLNSRVELSSSGISNINCFNQVADFIAWGDVEGFEWESGPRLRTLYHDRTPTYHLLRGKGVCIRLSLGDYREPDFEEAILARLPSSAIISLTRAPNLFTDEQPSSAEENVVVR